MTPIEITKAEFYKLGGFSNPKLFSKEADGHGDWHYYMFL